MKLNIATAAILTTGLIAGCGSATASKSSSQSASRSFAYVSSAASIPSCAKAPGHAIKLPASFPRQFPFPNGTLIYRTKPLRFKHQIGIYGFVPSPGFASSVNFFRNQVPRQGFKLLHFEVDAPNDSEGTYRGFGKIGIWQLRKIFGCKSAMTIAVSSEPIK